MSKIITKEDMTPEELELFEEIVEEKILEDSRYIMENEH